MNFVIRKIWLIFSLIFFVILFVLSPNPNPFKKTYLWLSNNSSLKDRQEEAHIKLEDILSTVFSSAPLFNKYDVFFSNVSTSTSKCDQDIILMIDKNSSLYPTAAKYFGEPFTDDQEIVQYIIHENTQMVVRSFPVDRPLNYRTWTMYSWSGADNAYVDESGQIHTCPEESNYLSIIKFYTKPNFLNWIISVTALFFISIISIGGLRTVWEDKKDK